MLLEKVCLKTKERYGVFSLGLQLVEQIIKLSYVQCSYAAQALPSINCCSGNWLSRAELCIAQCWPLTNKRLYNHGQSRVQNPRLGFTSISLSQKSKWINFLWYPGGGRKRILLQLTQHLPISLFEQPTRQEVRVAQIHSVLFSFQHYCCSTFCDF